jgi:hypothetical protein
MYNGEVIYVSLSFFYISETTELYIVKIETLLISKEKVHLATTDI